MTGAHMDPFGTVADSGIKCSAGGEAEWCVLPHRAALGRADLSGTLGRAALGSLLGHLMLVALVGAPVAGKRPGSAADALRNPLHATLALPRPAPVPSGMAAPLVPMAVDDVASARPSRSAAGAASVATAPPPPVAGHARQTPPATPAQIAALLALDGLPAPRYYLPREVDQPAVPLEHAHLMYPEDALKRRIGGVVVMHLFIGADGRLERTEVVRAEPPGVFEEAVRHAAAASRFRAAMLGQRAVSSRVTIEVPFDPNCSDFETCTGR